MSKLTILLKTQEISNFTSVELKGNTHYHEHQHFQKKITEINDNMPLMFLKINGHKFPLKRHGVVERI